MPPSTPGKTASERSGSVQSVERSLRLLELLGEDDEGLRLTDLAAKSGLSPSTVHRLMTTLEKRHFVQFDQTDGLWHVGRQAFQTGSSFVRRRNFVAAALPYLRKLRDQTKETANLGVAHDGRIILLAQVESREIMRAITRVGGTTPMVTSGMGKAILATYGEDDAETIFATHSAHKMTPKSITKLSDLRSEFNTIKDRGYSIDDEEFLTGLRCIAAVVYSHQAEPLCALSVSGLTQRLTDDRLASIGTLVSQTAREMTLALGGRMPGQND